ncbi:MAG TPA: VOC family protein [Pyrinomonadaceae bacterium]|jgi:catechol 2,3-dioxygenase-like lactoylglutathione lyase family enzyme|nr:VOC family protein [Pyrinomonadaceae bacterium]
MSRNRRFNTFGLTHVAVRVADIERSVRFYADVFGCELMYREDSFAQVSTPGSNDIIVFELEPKLAGQAVSGIIHFGFRLVEAVDIEIVREAVESAGGRVKDYGEFEPGAPYLFFDDPDGYEVEVWFEKL